ncbi:gamma-tubulin complex component 6-like isoform X2 [Ornithodoros turicata]|uniref:gamma-tubulin complex component 6-like isoform X2 n=1 Tax=Ornithodoros turicata TaxID=34597 RepID=UPI003138BAB9
MLCYGKEMRGCQSPMQEQGIPSLIADLCRSVKASMSKSLGGNEMNGVSLKDLKSRAFALLLGQTQTGGLNRAVEVCDPAMGLKMWPAVDVLQAKLFEVTLSGRKDASAKLKQCFAQLCTCSKGMQSCVQFLVLLSEDSKRNSTDVILHDKLFDLHQNFHSQNDSTWYTEYSSDMFQGMERLSHHGFTHLLSVFETVPGFDTSGNQLFTSFGGGGEAHNLPWSCSNLSLPTLSPLTKIARYRMRHRIEQAQPNRTPKTSSNKPQETFPTGVLPSAPSTCVESRVLLQHVLYLLAGIPSESFLWDKVRFVSRRGLYTKGLSEQALRNALAEFLECGTDVHYLVEWSKERGEHGGLVLAAFRGGIRRYLHSYHGVLLCITHNLDKVTLLRMRHLTADIQEQMRFVASFCREVLHFNTRGTTVRGSELLARLYWVAATGWCRSHYTLLLQLLHYASEPYCRFLQNWLFRGQYSDPFQEFPICMDKCLTSIHDETFWLKGFTLRPSQGLPFLSHLSEKVLLCVKTVTLLWLCQPQKTALWSDDSAPMVTLTFSRELSRNIREASRSYVSKKWNEVVGCSSKDNVTCNPDRGLHPTETTTKAEKNPGTGTGKGTSTSDDSSRKDRLQNANERTTICMKHSETSLDTELKYKVQPDETFKYGECDGRANEEENSQQSSNQVISGWSLKPLPLLGSLPEPCTSWESYAISDYCTDISRSEEMLLPLDGALEAAPLVDLVEQSLLPPLEAQMHLVNRAAVDYFLHKLELPSHLQAIGDFFCLQDGDFAQTLCSGICERITTSQAPSDLLNRSTLGSILSDALAASPRGNSLHVRHLAMDARNIPESFSSGDNVLSSILLSYEVQWPLNLVITDSSLQRYNKVFHFLLQIQRAHWALADVWFRIRPCATKASNYSGPQLRKLHVIRHEMENFVQQLASYVNSQAVEVTLRELQDSLYSKVQTLDDIRQAHTTCVSRLGRRCLLVKRAAPIARVLHRVLNCIMQLRTCVVGQPWVSGDQGAFEQVLRIHGQFRGETGMLSQALKWWGTSASLPWCTRLSSVIAHGENFMASAVG